MTTKKKVIIGSVVVIVALAVILLLMAFVFDSFGLYTKDYKLNFDKYVKLGEYKGLEYTKTKVSVTEKEIKEEINTRLAAKATTEEIKKGKVKDGDTISVTYEGKIDGKTFEGGSAENYSITVGETSMIDGFVEGLVGKKIGETVKLDLKFPKDYQNTDVAGKDVVFTVTINSKQKTTTPKYNVDFVKENSDYDNLKDYEASVKKDLMEQKEEAADSETKSTLWNQVVSATKVKKYPKKQLEYETERLKKTYKDQAEQNGMKWKEYLKATNTTEKAFNKQVKTWAKDVVKQKLTMYAIADKENLDVSNKKYKDYLDDILKNAGYDEDSFKRQFNMSIEEYGEQNEMKTNMILQEVMDKVLELGKEKKK